MSEARSYGEMSESIPPVAATVRLLADGPISTVPVPSAGEGGATAQRAGGFDIRFGNPLPLGATVVDEGVNFSIVSMHATACTLVLFKRGEAEPFTEIPFPANYRVGRVFAMTVIGLDPAQIEYGYRFDGAYAPAAGHYFDKSEIVLDPMARLVSGRDVWESANGNGSDGGNGDRPPTRFLGRIAASTIDWEPREIAPLPESDLIIYEMHVRGFTRHPSSGVAHPGTFAALREKIPYLKELGVNCIELMPIFEFDETENTRTNPVTGEPLCNYWGYSTVAFCAPKAGFAAAGAEGRQDRELRELIADLHANGIRVVLDVVFNHTAEGGADGPVISFRGIDNKTYYLLDAHGAYLNFTGCGNTFNANHPIVRTFIRHCLEYWTAEYHIDGFRFDLASALTRGSRDGAPLENPPLIEGIADDPLLADCTLIAEAWDAAGLYQVGSFPCGHRWLEWNGKFRDAARRFLRGDNGIAGELVQRIMGSPDLYKAAGRKPTASINFITCHDGFTLHDLFAYNEKSNLDNGENNRDGANDNWSWNCGAEGPTDDPNILALRRRQIKNACALLLISQGIPMLYMGDEVARSQHGNNNAYCHDTDWNWLDWGLARQNADILEFVKRMVAFRKFHPALRRPDWLTGLDTVGSGYPDISWHGVTPWKPDWSYPSKSLAFLLCGRHSRAIGGPPHFIYAAFNMYYEPLEFMLPVLPRRKQWHLFADTSLAPGSEINVPGEEPIARDQKSIRLLDRACAILVGR